ncbi:MAG: DeoR/GlpR family DNA-binding transcription regulator [Bacilli bacterium]
MIRKQLFANIINLIDSHGFATYKEMSDALNCSESTVRRAVEELSASGKLTRERGGASSTIVSDFFSSDQNLITRERIDAPIKKKLAEKALTLIKDNMTIYLDAGSTTLFLARMISNLSITVVTNSFTIAKILTERHINTFLIGGQLKLTTDASIGPMAIEAISRFTFNYGFFGSNGVTPENGFSTPDMGEAYIKRIGIEKSLKSVFLVDANKFNKNSVVSFSTIKDKTIITNYKDTEGKYKDAKIMEV